MMTEVKERSKGTEYQCPKCKKWFGKKELAKECFSKPDDYHKYELGDRVKVRYWGDGDHMINRDATVIGIGFRVTKGHLREPVYIFGPSWGDFGSKEYGEKTIVKLIKKYKEE